MLWMTKRDAYTFAEQYGRYYTLAELAEIMGCTRQRAHQVLLDVGVNRMSQAEMLRELRELKGIRHE